jgi:formylglycine-generating enzyme required for sulfatase activity
MPMRSLQAGFALALATFGASVGETQQPSRSFRDCRECPEMIVIPGGRFLMGSPESEHGRDVIEGPRHAVNIRRFAAGKYDITRGEWRVFADATHRPTISGCQWIGPTREHEASANWKKLDFVQTDRHPVVCVTWTDAQDYVRWLSAKTHHRYRLLSEAEWEYAARAGTQTAFPWRSGSSHAFANHGTAKCCGGLAEGRDKWLFTSPAGAFPPNPFGLYDMSGNVLQFVADCFTPTYDPASHDGKPMIVSRKLSTSGNLADLNGTNSCNYRVVRGGDWGDQSAWIRPAARSFAPPPGPGATIESYRSGGVGFRVARDLP